MNLIAKIFLFEIIRIIHIIKQKIKPCNMEL